MTQRLRRPLVALAVLTGVALTLAAFSSWLLYAPSGRAFLAERLGRALSGPEVKIRLEGLDGLPFAPRLASLKVSDASGPIATAEDLGAEFDVSGLFSRPMRFKSFSVERADVLRRPAETQAGAAPGRLSLPGKPGLIVERAAVGRLRLTPDFSGLSAPLDFTLTSSLGGREGGDGGRLSLDASELPASGAPRTRLAGALEWDSAGRPALFSLDLTDSPTGLAAALAGRPLPGALSASVALARPAPDSPGSRRDGALSGPATLAIDGQGDLAATVGLEITEKGGADVSLDGTTSLPVRLLADLLGQATAESLLPERLPFRFAVGVADESVHLREARVDARPGSLRANGALNMTDGIANLDLRVEDGQLAPLSGLLGAQTLGGFTLSASFQGRIDAPRNATASLSLSADPRVGQAAARKLEATASLRPEASGVAASLSLNVEGLETPETRAASPESPAVPPIRLAVEAFRPTQDEFPGGLRLDRLELGAPPARLTGVGGVGASDRGWLDLALHLDSSGDRGDRQDAGTHTQAATLRLEGDFSGRTSKFSLAAESPDFSRFSTLPAAARLSRESREFLFAVPGPATLTASAELAPPARPGEARALSLREATLALLGLEATAHGAWSQPNRAERASTFELDLAVRATDAEATPRLLALAALPESLRGRLAGGRLTIDARAEGKTDDFGAKATLNMPGAALGVQVQAEASRLPRAPEGQFTARLTDSGQTSALPGNGGPAPEAAVNASAAPLVKAPVNGEKKTPPLKTVAKNGPNATKTPSRNAPGAATKASTKAPPPVPPSRPVPAQAVKSGPVALDLAARFQVKPQTSTLLIEDLRATSGDNRATGKGAIDLRTGLVDGSLDAALNDLSAPARLLGLSLGGTATLTATASHASGASKTATTDGQQLKLDATASGLTFSGGSVSRATAALDLKGLQFPPRGSLALSASGLQAGPVRFETFTASGDGASTPAAPFRFRIEGANPAPRTAALLTSGELAMRPMRTDQNGEAGEARLNEFAYKGAGPGVRLTSPARLAFSPSRADLDGFRLTTQEGGTLTLSGNVTPVAVALRLEAAGLPVSLARNVDLPFNKGRLDASLSLSGAPANPSGQLRASVVELTSDDRALSGLPSAALNLNGDLAGGRLRVSGRSEGGLVRTPLVFSGEAPMRLSLWPLRAPNLNEPGLALTANGQVDLARLARILPLLNQRMSGLAALNARADGSVANPNLSGTVDLTEGVFEDADNGFAIRNLSGRARLQGRQAIIEGITGNEGGTEGDKGKVTAAGWFNIFADPGPRYSFDLTLTDAHVLRRARLDGTATGAANFTGDFDASIFTAQLTVQPLTIILPDGGNGMDLKGVKLTEVNAPPGQPKVERIPVNKFPIDLGMELILPAKAYLKDRNLDSEWKGRLTLGGQDHASKLGGRLDLVRGTYLFVDKKLTLTQGFIEFAGTYPIQAYLEVEAEATIPGGKAFIALVGESTAPMLFLRSEPPLPDDEILSQVLFGKGVANITPWQAVTLARAMRAATGGGRGASIFDIVGNTRKFLGLDELDVRSTETADGVGAALSVGKQISDQVFLRAERGLTPQSGKVTLQVDVNPNLNLESDVGEAGAGIGLNWKYDY